MLHESGRAVVDPLLSECTRHASAGNCMALEGTRPSRMPNNQIHLAMSIRLRCPLNCHPKRNATERICRHGFGSPVHRWKGNQGGRDAGVNSTTTSQPWPHSSEMMVNVSMYLKGSQSTLLSFVAETLAMSAQTQEPIPLASARLPGEPHSDQRGAQNFSCTTTVYRISYVIDGTK